MINISVITPVMNRVDLTYDFLRYNWRHYSADKSVDWIIIDNGSTDNTQDVLATWGISMRDRLQVITNPRNYGFSRANNQAAKIAKGKILVFANNDLVVNGDWLKPIREALSKQPDALAGAHLLDYDTGWNRFGDELIPYLAGWCLAMRRETFDDLGGFDERYSPADFEDVDISHAASQQGRPLIGLALPLIHLSDQTGKHCLPDRRTITERNKLKFAKKWGFANVENT